MKKNEIVVKRGMATEIAVTMGVTRQTVYKALRGDDSVRKYKAIRTMATEKMKEYNQ